VFSALLVSEQLLGLLLASADVGGEGKDDNRVSFPGD